MKKNTWRIFAGLFLIFMLAVAALADRGMIPPWIRFIYRFQGGDWVGHFVLYGMLAYLGARAFSKCLMIAGKFFPLSMLVTILLATVEELSQFWFPLRSPDWRDLSFGILGILAATWLATRLNTSDH
jgi:VanZ family protein